MVLLIKKNYCQSDIKSLDLILVINERIVVGSITSVQLEIISDSTSILKASYFPGNLSMSAIDYKKLFSLSVRSIYLKFIYYEYINSIQKIYNYDIELKKPWLNDDFNIIRIYNLDNAKYKGRFDPVEKGKNYNFELESPSHSFQIISKKNRSN
jgi:hypothetical protein